MGPGGLNRDERFAMLFQIDGPVDAKQAKEFREKLAELLGRYASRVTFKMEAKKPT